MLGRRAFLINGEKKTDIFSFCAEIISALPSSRSCKTHPRVESTVFTYDRIKGSHGAVSKDVRD